MKKVVLSLLVAASTMLFAGGDIAAGQMEKIINVKSTAVSSGYFGGDGIKVQSGTDATDTFGGEAVKVALSDKKSGRLMATTKSSTGTSAKVDAIMAKMKASAREPLVAIFSKKYAFAVA